MYTLTLSSNEAMIGQGLVFEGATLRASFEFAGTPLPAIFYGYPVFTWTIGERSVEDPEGGPLTYGVSASYATTQADIGLPIWVSMRLPFREEWYSAASARPVSVVNVNDLPRGSIRIEGDTRSAGSVLSAVSTITDEDGMGALGFQWRADGQAIAGATGATLTLGQAEAGKNITVVASYVDGFGQAESVASDADPAAVHANTPGSLRIGGKVAAGQMLHANVADPDHAGHVYYQWQVADGSGAFRDVDGAWSSQFTPGADGPVQVLATYADRYGVVEYRANAVGTEGADRMTASGANLTLMARGGDDIIEHRGRSHRIDGGTGLDTFVTAHTRHVFYQTRDVPGQWEVMDVLLTADPILLTNVERVHFRNGADGVALDYDGHAGHAGQAYRLYQAAFDRTPDKIGQGFWMNRLDIGVGLTDIANAFVASSEFKQLYGANPTNAEIVARFYQNVLHRAPDPQSQFWVDVLDSKRATVAEVLVGFSESAENVAALVGVASTGIDFTPHTGA